MTLLYFTFIYTNGFLVENKSIWLKVHLIVAHIFLALFITAYLQTILRDAGKVPLFWGFYIDQNETKSRRYCLICHLFKPERSHHCSACNRCVLNMDHHCPWLNNCIGFNNRKYFLLLLFYGLALKLQVLVFYFPVWLDYSSQIIQNSFQGHFYPNYLTTVVYIMNAVMICTLGIFFRFHVKLVFQNMTTLEHMDRKRDSLIKNDMPNYDMGPYYNFIQVFGRNPLYWLLPFNLRGGKPVGDGVVWPHKPSSTQTYEVDVSIRDASAQKTNSQLGDKNSNNITPNKDYYSSHTQDGSSVGFEQFGKPPKIEMVGIGGFQAPNKPGNKKANGYNSQNNYDTNYNSQSTNANLISEALMTHQSRHPDLPVINSNFSTQRQNVSPDF